MKIIKRISQGTTTHRDSQLVQLGFFLFLVIGLLIGLYLGSIYGT